MIFDLEKNSNTIYYIFAIIGGIVAFFKFFLKFFKNIYNKISTKYKYLEDSLLKIEQISKELSPNSGSSIKDSINEMRKSLTKNTELTEQILYRQRWLLDNQKTAIFESDKDGLCVWVNSYYLELVKREAHFLLGNGWINVISEEDRARVQTNWNRSVMNNIDYEDTYYINDSKGKKIKVFCSACKTDNSGYIGALEILES